MREIHMFEGTASQLPEDARLTIRGTFRLPLTAIPLPGPKRLFIRRLDNGETCATYVHRIGRHVTRSDLTTLGGMVFASRATGGGRSVTLTLKSEAWIPDVISALRAHFKF